MVVMRRMLITALVASCFSSPVYSLEERRLTRPASKSKAIPSKGPTPSPSKMPSASNSPTSPPGNPVLPTNEPTRGTGETPAPNRPTSPPVDPELPSNEPTASPSGTPSVLGTPTSPPTSDEPTASPSEAPSIFDRPPSPTFSPTISSRPSASAAPSSSPPNSTKFVSNLTFSAGIRKATEESITRNKNDLEEATEIMARAVVQRIITANRRYRRFLNERNVTATVTGEEIDCTPLGSQFEKCFDVTDSIAIADIPTIHEEELRIGLNESAYNGTLQETFDSVSSLASETRFVLHPRFLPPLMPTPSPSSMAPTSREFRSLDSTSSNLSAGEIAGIVLGASVGVLLLSLAFIVLIIWLAWKSTVVVVDFTKTRMDENMEWEWNDYAEIHKGKVEEWLRNYYKDARLQANRTLRGKPRSVKEAQTLGDESKHNNAGMEEVAFRLTCDHRDYKKHSKAFTRALVEKYGKKYGITSLDVRLMWTGSAKLLHLLPEAMVEEVFQDLKKDDMRRFSSGDLEIYVDNMTPVVQAKGKKVDRLNNLFKRKQQAHGEDVVLYEHEEVDLLIPNSANGGSRLAAVPFFRKVEAVSGFFRKMRPQEPQEPSIYKVRDSILLVKASEEDIIEDLKARGYHEEGTVPRENGRGFYIRMVLEVTEGSLMEEDDRDPASSTRAL